MANHRAYMKMYWGDFLADTMHLNAAETGAYLMLIAHYWQSGGLPSDEHKLAVIARVTPKKWQKISPVIAKFFQPNWRHKRIDRELQLADELHEKLSLAGVIGRAKQRARPKPGPGLATHTSYKKITTTESNCRESKEEANQGSKAIEPTDALRETIERKGWRSS